LAAVSERVCAQLGIRAALPTVNTTRHPDYQKDSRRSPYDAEMAAVMQEVYGEDFEAYGYDPAPP